MIQSCELRAWGVFQKYGIGYYDIVLNGISTVCGENCPNSLEQLVYAVQDACREHKVLVGRYDILKVLRAFNMATSYLGIDYPGDKGKDRPPPWWHPMKVATANRIESALPNLELLEDRLANPKVQELLTMQYPIIRILELFRGGHHFGEIMERLGIRVTNGNQYPTYIHGMFIDFISGQDIKRQEEYPRHLFETLAKIGVLGDIVSSLSSRNPLEITKIITIVRPFIEVLFPEDHTLSDVKFAQLISSTYKGRRTKYPMLGISDSEIRATIGTMRHLFRLSAAFSKHELHQLLVDPYPDFNKRTVKYYEENNRVVCYSMLEILLVSLCGLESASIELKQFFLKISEVYSERTIVFWMKVWKNFARYIFGFSSVHSNPSVLPREFCGTNWALVTSFDYKAWDDMVRDILTNNMSRKN